MDSDVTTERSEADAIIEQVRDLESQRFGAACCYELYEERRRVTIRDLLGRSTLSQTEALRVCKELNFDPDPPDRYYYPCRKCGASITAEQMARSAMEVGDELCLRCHADAIM